MSEETKDESAPAQKPAPSEDESAPPETTQAEAAASVDAEPTAAEPTAAEPKKKKKAKKPEAPTDDSPEGKSLREAEIAFEVGDYRRARELASGLAGSTRAPIADAARDLLRRTDVDPIQMVFLALCACALIGIAYYYLGN